MEWYKFSILKKMQKLNKIKMKIKFNINPKIKIIYIRCKKYICQINSSKINNKIKYPGWTIV